MNQLLKPTKVEQDVLLWKLSKKVPADSRPDWDPWSIQQAELSMVICCISVAPHEAYLSHSTICMRLHTCLSLQFATAGLVKLDCPVSMYAAEALRQQIRLLHYTA